MKYTILQQEFKGSNLHMYVRVYVKTADKKSLNEFLNDNYVAVASANTVKEARQIIENLGGDMERIS